MNSTLTLTPEEVTVRESRYRVFEHPLGFRVEGSERIPVEIRLEHTHWSVESAGDEEYRRAPSRIGLYSYGYLLEEIASILMHAWQPPDGRSYPAWPLRAWALEQTRRALHAPVYTQWRRLLNAVADPIQSVTRSVFAATFDRYLLGCESWEELYSGAYHQLIKDVINYRAAAIACHNALALSTSVSENLARTRECLQPGTAPSAIEARYASLQDRIHRYWIPVKDKYEEQKQEAEAKRAILEALSEDWKAFFSFTGLAYRSLNRTLMSFPGGIPNNLVTRFPFLEVTRPLTNRIELVTQLMFNEHLDRMLWPRPQNLSKHWANRIVAKATADELRRALNRFSAHEHLSKRLTSALIYQFSLSICGYCTATQWEHTGNIVGLTEKTIAWKKDQMTYRVAQFDRNTPTARPLIPLPANSRIQFLPSVGAVIDEGNRMSHCIADYTEKAINGEVYLFHINHSLGEASTMVNAKTGLVDQSYGPGRRPTPNQASMYGKRILASWAKKLPIRDEVCNHIPSTTGLHESDEEGNDDASF